MPEGRKEFGLRGVNAMSDAERAELHEALKALETRKQEIIAFGQGDPGARLYDADQLEEIERQLVELRKKLGRTA